MHHCGKQLDTSSMDDSTTTIQLRRRPGPVVEVQRPASQGVLCAECGKRFSWPGDLKRHNCLIERFKPIEQKQDTVQGEGCHKWFHSKGHLAAHKCKGKDSSAL